MISPCGGRCESYSSARLIRLRAQISAMASMASRISGSTARNMAEKEKSSAEGSCSPLAARPADKPEACGCLLMAKDRGVLTPEPGREAWREAEYVRTTTGWLVTVVRLEADFADLLLAGDEWKAGALRARRAADWVGGSVFVSVVVALGTELVLSSKCPIWASKAGSWVAMGGTALCDELVCATAADDVLVPQSVDSTPSATDCLVVVAGVSFGGRAPESAAAEAWLFEAGPESGGAAVRGGSTCDFESAGHSGMVGSLLQELQVIAWPLCDAV